MEIRQDTALDVDQLAQVNVAAWHAAYRGLIPDHYLSGISCDEELRLKWLHGLSSGHSSRCFAAIKREQIVGYARIGPDCHLENTAELLALYLLPAHWRSGIGRALFLEAKDYAKNEGFEKLTVWVLKENSRAIKFYEAMGLSVDGSKKFLSRADWRRTQIRMVYTLK